MRRKQSMMGSSKYEFEPEEFEKDLESILCKDYYYRDGSKMSYLAKRDLLIEVHKEFIERCC